MKLSDVENLIMRLDRIAEQRERIQSDTSIPRFIQDQLIDRLIEMHVETVRRFEARNKVIIEEDV